VAAVIERDHAGNAVVGDAALIDSSRNLVHSESQLTTMIGVDDLVVVSTKDSLLVAKKERAQDVKELVARLQKDGRSEANEALKIFRPWGNYDRLDIGIGYQVKRIVVKPGGILSLQKHRHRAEHWVIVQGEAEVTIENTICTVSANQSAYVPLGAIHRLANRGTKSLVLIEVQTGTYLGEDDIVRFEDDYNRVVSI
jgi:mannose-1-phosphate guanylyltransferase/mannose-6-phosphate isomerase